MPPLECKECRGKLVQIDESILCSGGCGCFFCIKCSSLKRRETELMSENENIKWFCNQCTLSSTNTKFIEIKHLIENGGQNKIGKTLFKDIVEETISRNIQQLKSSLATEFNKLLEHNVDIKINEFRKDMLAELSKTVENNREKLSEVLAETNVNNNNTNANKELSYAQAAKQRENMIVIKPKDKAKKNKHTKVALKKVIEPTECHVTTVKEISNGGIVVQCMNKESCELVQKKIAEQIGDEFEMEKSREKRETKMFKVIGLTERLSSERLVECITKQNRICEGKEFKAVKIFENYSRREECYNALVETDIETYENIIKQKRINIEWDSCITVEYVRVFRCFKCLGFNHKADECINKKACSKCGASHDTKNCLSKVHNCVNCSELVQKKLIDVDVHHTAFDKECPALKRYLESKSRYRK